MHQPMFAPPHTSLRSLSTPIVWTSPWHCWHSSPAALWRMCEEAGRDPAQITTSVHQPFAADGLDELEANTADFKAAGLDLMVFYLPPPHRPELLEPLARIAERVG